MPGTSGRHDRDILKNKKKKIHFGLIRPRIVFIVPFTSEISALTAERVSRALNRAPSFWSSCSSLQWSVYRHPSKYQIDIPERHIPPQNQEPQLLQQGWPYVWYDYEVHYDYLMHSQTSVLFLHSCIPACHTFVHAIPLCTPYLCCCNCCYVAVCRPSHAKTLDQQGVLAWD